MSHDHGKIIIYVKVFNRMESIEFNSNTPSDDLKGQFKVNPSNLLTDKHSFYSIETLRVAAEANRNDLLKLYNHNGHLMTVSTNSLVANTPKNPYRLEVVFKNINGNIVIPN